MHRFIVAILLLAAPHGAFASPGALFAEPDFFTLGPGIGMGFPDDTAALGDVDGDGDVDLVVSWTRWSPHVYADDGASGEHFPHWGWTVASNDGLGGLVPTRDVMHGREEAGASSAPIISIWGDDFDGDGLLDLAFEEGSNFELWHNRGEDGFATILQLPNTGFVGLADGEGDGDLDLLVTGYEEYEDEADHTHDGTSQATLWFNDGDAEFVRSDQFTLDSEAGLWPMLWPAEQSLGAEGIVRLLWTRSCYRQLQEAGPTRIWLTQPWAASAEPPLSFESMVNPCGYTPLQVGRDGQVDLVGIVEVNRFLPHIHQPRLGAVASGRLGRGDKPHPARLAGTRARPPPRQRPQRRWSAGRSSGRWQFGNRSGLGRLDRPERWRARSRRSLPAAGHGGARRHGQRGACRRPQRRWGRRSGRVGAE